MIPVFETLQEVKYFFEVNFGSCIIACNGAEREVKNYEDAARFFDFHKNIKALVAQKLI